jgi:ribosomal protein S18 acetylase RimI-like enzyme
MTWIECRPVLPKDLPVIRAVLVETWHATYDRLYGATRVTEITDMWHAETRLAEQLGNVQAGQSAFWVGLWDRRIVSTASARCIGHERISLDQLYVRGPYQGLGIGTALLHATLAALPRSERIQLEVDPANSDAIQFYTRLGFHHVGAVDDCGQAASGQPECGLRAHVYERHIGAA